MGAENVICPICKSSALRASPPKARNIYAYWNCCCGSAFLLHRHDEATRLQKGEREKVFPDRLASLLYERSTKGLPQPFLHFDPAEHRSGGYADVPDTVPILAEEWLESEWPATIPARIDRCLCSLARKTNWAGMPIPLTARDIFLFFTSNALEKSFLLEALAEYGWIKCLDKKPDSPSVIDLEVVVTPKGWTRYYQLTEGTPSMQNPAFLAMWFGGKERSSEMSALYESALAPAVREAGFKVRRADSDQHNNYVMNQIIGYIRTAPFVVAELTNQNLGVYYEAGYAAGLGISVIPCCPTSESEKVHFDIQQVSQIRWESPDDLRRQLTARILGSIGRGPYQADT